MNWVLGGVPRRPPPCPSPGLTAVPTLDIVSHTYFVLPQSQANLKISKEGLDVPVEIRTSLAQKPRLASMAAVGKDRFDDSRLLAHRWPSNRRNVMSRSTGTGCLHVRWTARTPSPQEDVAPGCRFERRVLPTAQLGRRRMFFAIAGGPPADPVIPPRGGVALRCAEPGFSASGGGPGQRPVGRFLVGGRVDDGLDVIAGTQDELGGAPEELSCLVGGGRGDYVLGGGAAWGRSWVR